jgi:long-chain fatty acid transport protein
MSIKNERFYTMKFIKAWHTNATFTRGAKHALVRAQCYGSLALAALIAATMAIPSQALAGGFFMPVRGVRALSNGGAFVAGADDLSAMWYNPANLANMALSHPLQGKGEKKADTTGADKAGVKPESQLRLVVGVDAAAIFLKSSFKRLESGLIAYNEGKPTFVPTIGILTNFGKRRAPTLALGFYAPYAGSSTYPEEGPTRYSLVDSSGTLLAFLQLSLAYEIVPQLKIGVSLQNVFAKIRQVSTASTYTGLFGTAEDARLDMLYELSAQDMVTLTGNLGITYQPAHHSTLAFSVQFPFKLEADGTMRFRIPSSYFFDGVSVSGDRATATMRFPAMFRLGYRFKHRQLWEAEFALVYEMWRVHDKITITAHDISIDNIPGMGTHELAPTIIERNFKDTVSIHLGGSVHFPYDIEGRVGLMFETQAIPNENLDASLIDSNKIGIGLGISYAVSKLRFDLSYGFFYYIPRDISTSQMRQLNPTNPEDAVVVGNGEYQQNAHVLGFGISVLM